LDANSILEELKQQRARLDRAIAALDESPTRRVSVPRKVVARKAVAAAAPATAAAKGKKRGGMTPEGRKRLSLAMKKRWAERRKKTQ
jgi:hypothetical protein